MLTTSRIGALQIIKPLSDTRQLDDRLVIPINMIFYGTGGSLDRNDGCPLTGEERKT